MRYWAMHAEQLLLALLLATVMVATRDVVNGEPIWSEQPEKRRPAALGAFADLIDLAGLFHDYGFASRVIGDVTGAGHGLEYHQVDDPDSEYYGAFMRTTGNPETEFWADATAFDNLEMLLALHSFDTPVGNTCAPYFDPPVWDRDSRVGELLTFTVTAQDPDSPTLSLSMVEGPAGAVFVDHGDGTGTFSWTPGVEYCGQDDVPVVFQANDGTHGTTEEARLSVAVCPLAMTVYEAKMLLDGAQVVLNGKIVTWTDAGSFYIEEPTRFAGVLVLQPDHPVAVGVRVNVKGTIETDSDGERFVAARSVEDAGTGLLRPIGFVPPRAGWDSYSWRQPSYLPMVGSIGLGHTGLLMRTWGRVLESDPLNGALWLQHDGLNMRQLDPVIRCQAGPDIQVSPYWRFVQVTGVTSRNRFADTFDVLDSEVWLWGPDQKAPEVIGGWLNLYNTVWRGDNSEPLKAEVQGMEVQSAEEFLYGSLEVFARAEHWRNDTSIGLEKWYPGGHDAIPQGHYGIPDGHYGVVVTSEVTDPENPGGFCVNLGVIRQCRADYMAIHGWEQIKRPEGNLFRFEWRSGNIKLYIDDVLRAKYPDPSSAIHEAGMVPNVPLRIRLNAGAPPADHDCQPPDCEDALYVDRVATAPEREIRVSPSGGIEPAGCEFYGLCFGPYLRGSNERDVTEDELRTLLSVIAVNTKWIRTYGCMHGLDAVGRIAHEMDVRAALCADIGSDEVKSRQEIDRLKQQIADDDQADQLIGGTHVDMAVVGNDVLCANKMLLPKLISYLEEVKQYIRGKGCCIPVTTGEAWGNLNGLDYAQIEDLSSVLDVVAFNCHPYNERVPIEAAVAHLDAAYSVLKSKYQGKELVVAETGWPDAGRSNGEAVASPENAAFFLANAMNWARTSNVKTFYFEAFDEAWKGTPDDYEAHLGIWTSDLKPVRKPHRLDALNCKMPEVVDGPGTPNISITAAYWSEGFVVGRTSHIDPNQYQVAVYIKVGNGWYVKPYDASPGSWINLDGTWGCDTCTDPQKNDLNATEIRAYLLPRSVTCPEVTGDHTVLPSELDAYPHDFVSKVVSEMGHSVSSGRSNYVGGRPRPNVN